MSATAVEPHTFTPLRPWDVLHSSGRCHHCYAPRFAHPMRCWVRARPLGDRSYQPLDFEHLHPAAGSSAENKEGT